MRNRNVTPVVGVLIVLAVGLAAGCASQTRTVKSTQTVEYPTQIAARSPEKEVVVEGKTTVTETRHELHGVLSTAIHVIGEVLALPFHLIGGLLRLVC